MQRQVAELDRACAATDRDPASVRKVLLWTPTEIISSVDEFDELVGPYRDLGFDQVVLHHPEQTGPYGGSCRVFEEIVSRASSTER